MAEEKQYYAKVKEIREVTGPGGGLTMCRVKLLDEEGNEEPRGRVLTRVIAGPIAVDTIVVLMDNEREQRSRLK
ncbi:hypothetical protein EDEG_03990 [Edhazardia aedis USNM 41457]|uniref:40S ribosomal protein S28 n=1 Tax=Edhazardia aedis (strain USNM 41457) TaxID=1003232 RepID=J9D1D0_EDHAE|nr:hypothetical protein EDEG_03990 [Edhazardia aedis USNM 41457]|eukprot:EJW01384.1 hypothetical protein EDEG_03990 [Edhazardia aedis USNM 41457]